MITNGTEGKGFDFDFEALLGKATGVIDSVFKKAEACFEGAVAGISVVEEGDNVKVELDLPGVDRSTLDIRFTRNEDETYRLDISAQRGETTHELSTHIDKLVKASKAVANYEDGVLTITVPIDRKNATSVKVDLS